MYSIYPLGLSSASKQADPPDVTPMCSLSALVKQRRELKVAARNIVSVLLYVVLYILIITNEFDSESVRLVEAPLKSVADNLVSSVDSKTAYLRWASIELGTIIPYVDYNGRISNKPTLWEYSTLLGGILVGTEYARQTNCNAPSARMYPYYCYPDGSSNEKITTYLTPQSLLANMVAGLNVGNKTHTVDPRTLDFCDQV